jgi:predicted ATPase
VRFSLPKDQESCVKEHVMGYKSWQKGSQWRKWDLHVHTPASFHWVGGKCLREMTSAEKDASFGELLKTLSDSDVAVFCFMDYWTFDGYLQFTEYLTQNNLSCSKTIFPGMELRIEAPVDYRLNIHVILSDALSSQQLSDFKSKLLVAGINRPISDECIMEFARSLDQSKASVHGFGNPNNLSPSELLMLGSSTIEITKESLRTAIQSIPSGLAYIILPYDTSDGLAKLDWKTQPHADNYFMQSAHIIESRKDETIDLFLGNKTEKNQAFMENFQKTLKNIQKPVICGSDAHRYIDFGKFPGNKATWIKADPTFNGFKQIIYEPRERVLLQELQPHEKIPYRVIDKVRFVDKTEKKLFSSEWMELNENLNTIIGGKSSGKSLLLYHIAKTISPELVKKRSSEVPILNYSFGEPAQFDFEVLWKDGRSDKLSTPSENTREIEYIPQLYVNALAEKQGESSLYKLIESILEQSIEYKEFIQGIKQEIKDAEAAIDGKVTELLRKRDELQVLYEERKSIGDLKAINGEIQRLSSEITELRNDSNFSEDESLDYEKLLLRQSEERKRRKNYDELSHAIDSLTTTLNQIKAQSNLALERFNAGMSLDRFSKRVLSMLINTAKATVTSSLGMLVDFQKRLADNARQKSIRCGDREKGILEGLQPYIAKINDQAKLRNLETKLKEQQEILDYFKLKTSLIEGLKTSGVQTKQELLTQYATLLDCYQKIIKKLVNEQYSKIDKDIVLEAHLTFDNGKFADSFCDLFNRRRVNFKLTLGTAFSEDGELQFAATSHVQTIFGIYDKLVSKSNADIFKRNVTAVDAISQLFKNYFKIEYNIRYRNDEILDMSPGKRGLVLLQLILHISNATHPILIDQPEDNLDNRTISNELKHFVSAKKLTRQIIMVTHDANLVVLTDAENVIVSNQDGQQINRENLENRFEYVAGALEHSYRPQKESPLDGILFSCGIREHVCEILEGGEDAFKKREQKYGLSN